VLSIDINLMKFGLSSDQYQFIKDTVITPLSNENAKVWCFGSRARGDFREFSDLDLLIECQSNKTDMNLIISSIEEVLINSNFPFKVDLVLCKNLAKSYAEKINSEKVIF